VFALTIPKVSREWRLFLSIVLECAWEIFENSPYCINRYREVTLALGYTGDTILNSLSDIFACYLGFKVAVYLGYLRSAILIFLIELVMLFAVKDCLALNVLMLIHPVQSIKEWQTPELY